MAKRIVYSEPVGYFTPEMRKVFNETPSKGGKSTTKKKTTKRATSKKK